MFVTTKTLSRILADQRECNTDQYRTIRSQQEARCRTLELRVANLEERYLMLLDHLEVQVVYPDKDPKPYLKEKQCSQF
jgi:hypothetical protein